MEKRLRRGELKNILYHSAYIIMDSVKLYTGALKRNVVNQTVKFFFSKYK